MFLLPSLGETATFPSDALDTDILSWEVSFAADEDGRPDARAAAETTLRPDWVVYTGTGGLLPLTATGSDCERASDAVEARRASIVGALVVATGGCPFPIEATGLAPDMALGLVKRETGVIASAEPGRTLGTRDMPGRASVACFPDTLPLLAPVRGGSE